MRTNLLGPQITNGSNGVTVLKLGIQIVLYFLSENVIICSYDITCFCYSHNKIFLQKKVTEFYLPIMCVCC